MTTIDTIEAYISEAVSAWHSAAGAAEYAGDWYAVECADDMISSLEYRHEQYGTTPEFF